MNILVVDDSETIRDRLVEILSTLEGVERVDTAARASDARQAIRSAPPDAVVLDIHMPQGSGMEVIEALRAGRQRITTIVLTNDSTPQSRDAYLRAGADFYFDKSADFQEVVDLIAHLALQQPAPRAGVPEYWTYFQRLPIPVWLVDVDSLKFKAVNDAAVGRYGYSREEFLAMTAADIRSGAAAGVLMEQIRQRRAGVISQAIATEEHRARDGSIIHVESTTCAFDRPGERLDLVLAHDVSERILAEEALRASENRYRELFEKATDAIFTTDLDLNFTSLNRVAQALTGYTHEEAKGLNISSIVTRETLELLRCKLDEQRAGKPVSAFEVEILARGRRPVPIEVIVCSIHGDGRPVGIQGIARDITERKRFEQGLRQAQKMEAIGRLAGGVAHDFNNLLTVIIGHSQELVDRLPPDDPTHGDAVQILTAGNHAADLTRQLLAFSRQQILAPKVLDINAGVRDLAPMLRRLIGEDVDLVVQANSAPSTVKADPGQLEQVIMNLVVNSRDAMLHGGTLTIETMNAVVGAGDTADRPSFAQGQYVVLKISDTGSGMDAQIKAQIFEPFFTTKDAGKGTGLGLSTVYGIVKQSGGYVFVDSEPGRGTVFSLYFPLAEGDISPTPSPSHRPDRGSESILIVEDDHVVRELAKTDARVARLWRAGRLVSR